MIDIYISNIAWLYFCTVNCSSSFYVSSLDYVWSKYETSPRGCDHGACGDHNFKEIEKLRLEQVEARKVHHDSERITAQLGRQVAEHRSSNEKYAAETNDLKNSLQE